MDAEGLEAVTMRRVGRELGVEAMSLYNHVQDKDDILNGIAELVMGTFEFTDATGDWREDTRAAAHAWRALLKSHPSVMILLSERRSPITSPDALRPTEHALTILGQAGLSPEDTVRAFRAFGGYIQGFVLMELANMFGEGDVPTHGADWASMLPAETFPCLCELAPHLMDCDPEVDFDFGLELLIRGLEARSAG
jgi:AcrR family transcriptional regulator